MSSYEAWHKKSEIDMILVRIYESKNLRYTLHANIEVLNRDGPPTNFRHTPVQYSAQMQESIC